MSNTVKRLRLCITESVSVLVHAKTKGKHEYSSITVSKLRFFKVEGRGLLKSIQSRFIGCVALTRCPVSGV